jgi:hypothetical protein
VPPDGKVSFDNFIIGVVNYEERWEWNFIFSDGTRTEFKSGYQMPNQIEKKFTSNFSCPDVRKIRL